jgi:DnaK suppressor protein
MVQFEAEAREFLLTRRRRLHGRQRPPAPAPESHWFETEALPEPAGEEARRELADIDAALERIDRGAYGRCLACDGPMGLHRMRAIPEARYCLGCSGQRPGPE